MLAPLLAAAATANEDHRAGELSIIPIPLHVEPRRGSFELRVDTPIIARDERAQQVASYFSDLLKHTIGVALPIGAQARDEVRVSFEIESVAGRQGVAAATAKLRAEAYVLDVTPQHIKVVASTEHGLFNGAVTLWQLISAAADSRVREPIRIRAIHIEDAPRFAWRGLMLDSARHYQSPEFIKRFIDTMALHKLNVLHWHLTDDQAWRLEIKKYPRLTAIGGWRVPAGAAAAADIDPATGEPRRYGGVMSQEQVRDIVAHAARRHVTIVPEIELPGHATAAIVAYPQLATAMPPVSVPADWGVYPHVYNVEESTFAFLEDVLAEVIALFPSEYIHVGGDEAVKEQWQRSPRVQARMRELGVADERALQSYFIHRIEKFINKHGRRLIGWDEILEGGLAPNATVMSWRGSDGALAAAATGHDAVLAPGPTLYFDNRQYANDRSPGRGTLVTLRDVYRFNPIPDALTPDKRRHILGLQGNLWTEHMRTEERVEYMALPRAAAVAEIAWSAAQRLKWSDFERRLTVQQRRYEALGVHFAQPPMTTQTSALARTSHELTLCTQKLVLSLEDDAPLRGQRASFLVDIMNPCWLFKGAELSSVSAVQASVAQVPFNFQLGKDIEGIRFREPSTADGELEVRSGDCSGEKIASLPLAPARHSDAVTLLPPAPISARAGARDLCFTFTQHGVDPLWVIDSVRLIESAAAEH